MMHTFVSEKGMVRKIFKCIADIRTPLTHSYFKWEAKNYWLRLSGMSISKEGVAIDHGFQCLTGLENNIFIDDYSAIGINVKFWNFNEIRVGKFCMFAAEVTLTNGGHDRNSFEPFSGPLVIGNGCWIGNGARIIGPLTIGDNAIVAAGAVVVDDVLPGSIVAGVPAKIIGMRNLPSKIWHLGNIYFCPLTFQIVKKGI
jgi:acetyltransferase-like isoleucine patch superfamily enzyme